MEYLLLDFLAWVPTNEKSCEECYEHTDLNHSKDSACSHNDRLHGGRLCSVLIEDPNLVGESWRAGISSGWCHTVDEVLKPCSGG